MYFNFNEKDYKKCELLLNTKENNICAAEYYIAYLSDDTYHIKENEGNFFKNEKDLSRAIIKEINKRMDIDENESNFVRINSNSHIDNLVELDPKDYTSNPYFKLIKNVSFKDKLWFMNTQYYKPYEMFTYDEIRINKEYYQETTPMGFFKDRFEYPALVEEEYIWMSLIPHEINTMKEPISHASGNVLVFGLGLGYFAFMVSNKENVKKVLVIEKDPNVISLFKKYLLDLFPHKEKIEIVLDDAYDYLDKLSDNDYNYAFIDIYHNVGDGFPLYVKFKPYEKKFPSIKFDYWIETSLTAMLRRYILTLYEEKVIYHYTDKDYMRAKNDDDRFINKLFFYLKDFEFKSYNEFHDFLDEDNLKKLLINL